ncbi:hypothetical protein [Nostoc sp. DedQUE09]|uniref:hypothetical protein n=1 Tax=Nostoc sp. DedQUE09 TaxID=3075394 RepID=UPI002AD3F0B1|nr:hypothetical protein [Nostoc sp. DedQUE09]MDZ7950572.1 hypothetical protein [Nostoc sp. DedQUE09]
MKNSTVKLIKSDCIEKSIPQQIMAHFTATKMELNLIKVYDSTLLSSSKVYQINGTLSRYLGDEGSIQHPQYLFVPLPNQRKKASFRLNRNKLMTRCYEVEGMVYQKPVVQDNSQQLQLF